MCNRPLGPVTRQLRDSAGSRDDNPLGCKKVLSFPSWKLLSNPFGHKAQISLQVRGQRPVVLDLKVVGLSIKYGTAHLTVAQMSKDATPQLRSNSPYCAAMILSTWAL